MTQLIKYIKDIQNKYPFDITKDELLNEFGYKLIMNNKITGGGSFSYCRKEIILINENGKEINNAVFCHEFSHLIQYSLNPSKYESINTIMNKLRMEWEADKISYSIWEWLYPNTSFSKYLGRYFKNDGVEFLFDYWKDYLEKGE